MDLFELAVAADQGDQVVQVTFEHGDVIADERERIVDLVRHAGHELAQAGELLGLDHSALGGLERFVGSSLGFGQFLKRDVLMFERLFGTHPFGHVPEDSLDSDRSTVGADRAEFS